MDTALQIFTTFIVTIEPIALTPIFVGLTHDQAPAARRQIAIRAVVVAAAILVVFAAGGELILRFLGISLAALRIGGGLLLLLLAIEMVFARESGIRSTTPDESHEAERRQDIAVFPLAIPLIAGPATITAVILMMGQARASLVEKGSVVVLLLVALGLTMAILLAASRITDRLGVTGINVVGRVLGIILAGLAVQFMLDGIAESGILR